MAKPDECMRDAHPADDELDRLRAGLIETSSAGYEGLRAHVQACARCQARGRVWARVGESLDAGAHEAGLGLRLRSRRERALRGEASRAPARRAAVAVFASFVVATLAIGLGMWTYLEPEPGDSQFASAPARDADSDLYADIDFYLWLLKREAANAAPNG
ncbi:hypothetical protein [Sulfurifustis variabilis]|uniref:hypothetical protein n=1 Tax=Sulfurifustis variabilis TaxID=1675686 RepID=UPI000BBAEF7F|nr:hypothetical protein [Sulfurifustis variabilis]